jgi:hypothetical protein
VARCSKQLGRRSKFHAVHCGGLFDPKLLENHIDIEKIDADSVGDYPVFCCPDQRSRNSYGDVFEYLFKYLIFCQSA